MKKILISTLVLIVCSVGYSKNITTKAKNASTETDPLGSTSIKDTLL
jgi:hypothetical protein